MSIWTYIEGTATIPKKEKVSIRDLVDRYFGDEFTIGLETESVNEDWRHIFHISVCMEGYEFMKCWALFDGALKATQKDITCTIRFL